MTISIEEAIKRSKENQGIITDDVVLDGDLGGTLPSPTLESINDRGLPEGNGAVGAGLRIGSDGNWEFQTIITEDSPFSGDVSGSQADGLTVNRVDGQPFEITSPASGDTIQYNGSTFVNVPSTNPDTNFTILSADTTVSANSTNVYDSRNSVLSLTLPADADISAGSWCRFIDGHGSSSTNNISILPNTGQTIAGDSGGLLIEVDNIDITIVNNGDEWNYFVNSSRS